MRQTLIEIVKAREEAAAKNEPLPEFGGPAGDLMESKVDVLPWAQDLYVGFFECDRDFNGNVMFRGMNAVLDDYGITDSIERQEIRFLWRSMDSARREKRDELKEEK